MVSMKRFSSHLSALRPCLPRTCRRRLLWVWGLAACCCTLLLMACRPVNQIDHLEADVAEMRYHQRRADNKAFYDYWLQASHHISRIEEEVTMLTDADRERFLHARNEFYLTAVTYHHAMGHADQARADLAAIDTLGLAVRDTAQWLHYRYLCDLAAHIPPAELARQALRLAATGDSVYWVTEARIYQAAALNREGSYAAALDTLAQAYHTIADDDVPECLCRISEQQSVAWAGLNRKDSSDIYRNRYLDMLEVIRENKEWEYRTQHLEQRRLLLHKLFVGFAAFLDVFVIGFIILAVTAHVRHRRYTRAMKVQYGDRVEQLREERALHTMTLERNKRDNVVRKASLSIVTSIIPYIDRARREIRRLEDNPSLPADERQRSIQYVGELTDHISELNDILTLWIQTKQGMVGLHLETFAVEEVLRIVAGRRRSFEDQHLTLTVHPSDAVVKADKALTLFMLNTLADNARKFTPQGGTVTIGVVEKDDYVELAVEDTGIGLSAEDVESIMGSKVYDASQIGDPTSNKGSGFGLMNCKGIIEKYRKTDSFFAPCRFGIDSEKGKGSRFWFRLPRVARRAVVMAMLMAGAVGATEAAAATAATAATEATETTEAFEAAEVVETDTLAYDPLLAQASSFADSVYYANVDGLYELAVEYGDSAIGYLNRHCMEQTGGALDSLTLTGSRGGIVERQWWMSDFATDYYTILDIRNELAVAFLALHRLDDYDFNNRSYTELFKFTGEDTTLADYCAQMTEASNDILTMIVLSILVLTAFVVVWYTMVMRPRKAHRRELEKAYRALDEQENEDHDMRFILHEENRLHVQNMVLDNCLSTIKHETSYYPGAIHQIAGKLLTESGDEAAARKQVGDMSELVNFYRDIFGTLASCASRQLEEVTFRRTTVSTADLLAYAAGYLARKAKARGLSTVPLHTTTDGSSVEGDRTLLEFLFENLIDVTLAGPQPHELTLDARQEGDFVCFRLTNDACTLTQEELRGLFYPSNRRMQATAGGQLEGAEYIVSRQIIREHDEYFGHVGCRIAAEQAAPDGGLAISFTIPLRKNK